MENNFIKCGLAGWSAELCYSSLIARTRDHDKRLMGQTSLYMFPIYGMAAAIGPIRQKLCAWDYSQAKLNVDGLIRLDFAPFWFALGLFFERCTAAS